MTDPSYVHFTVAGVPVPQGSMSAVLAGGKPVVIGAKSARARAALTDWRQAIRAAAPDGRYWSAGEPVAVTLAFRLPRPPSVTLRKRPYPTVKPDIDKLTRAALDALTGVLWHDDAQVVTLVVTKSYAPEAPRLDVWVSDRSEHSQ